MPAEIETCADRFAAALDRAAQAGNWAVLPYELTMGTAQAIGEFSIVERTDKYGIVIVDITFLADGSTVSLLDEEKTRAGSNHA